MNEIGSSRSLWIEAPKNLNLGVPFLKARPLRPLGDDKLECEATTDRGLVKLEIPLHSSYALSNGDSYNDMC